MLQAAHVPTAGALHDAPVSIFLAAFFFAFSEATEGLQTSKAAKTTTHRDFVIRPPRELVSCYSPLLPEQALDVSRSIILLLIGLRA